jgi:hypothetical protein
MSLTKITSTVINTLSSFFSINGSTGAITTNVPDLIGSNTTLYPSFSCRAWVNFDGVPSTPTIRASGNVLSVTKTGTGDYTVNFITAMPDVNYCIFSTAHQESADNTGLSISVISRSTTGYRIRYNHYEGGTFNLRNCDYVGTGVFR